MAQRIASSSKDPLWKKPYRKATRKQMWTAFRRSYLSTHKTEEHWRCEHCTKPMYYSGEVEVDHIEKRSLRPDLVFEPSNLRILCHACHVKRHK